MKTVAEYLEHAAQSERLAADERDPKFKATLMEQAKHCRELARHRIDWLNLPFAERGKNPG